MTNPKLAEWVARQQPKQEEEQVEQMAKPEPTEATQVEPEAVVEQPIEAQVEEKVNTEEPKKEDEKPVEVEQPASSWDEDEAPAADSKSLNFVKLGQALELDEVDEDKAVAKVAELKTKLKELEGNPLAGIPEDFKEVLEVAKKTGDWKKVASEMLNDFSKVHPLDIYDEYIYSEAAKYPQFRNQDGSLNEKAVQEYIESRPEVERMMEGSKIQRQLIQQQEFKKQQLLKSAQEREENASKDLKKAAASLNDILPVQNYGIKFESKHSNEIAQGITNSSLTKKYLGVSYETLVREGADMKEVAATVAMRHYGDKMLKHKSTNAQTSVKRELLNKIQSPSLKSPGIALKTDPPSDDKPKTPVELMKAHMEKQRKVGL